MVAHMDMDEDFLQVYDETVRCNRFIRKSRIVDVAEAGIELTDIRWTAGEQTLIARVGHPVKTIMEQLRT